MTLIREVKHAILLSGTPTGLGTYSLYNQIDGLQKGLLGSNRFAFKDVYCGGSSHSHVPTRNRELNCLLRHVVMIRRTKLEVCAQLPEKTRRIILTSVGKYEEDYCSTFQDSPAGSSCENSDSSLSIDVSPTEGQRNGLGTAMETTAVRNLR